MYVGVTNINNRENVMAFSNEFIPSKMWGDSGKNVRISILTF